MSLNNVKLCVDGHLRIRDHCKCFRKRKTHFCLRKENCKFVEKPLIHYEIMNFRFRDL
ncbi:hypothetical protein Syun_030095 [Stephania yunnanensis]|uniref:Uncharacterized protein n=1 Tax=Stephania yunnanensis TaxID=152371 RepID=A0AAP0E6W1_9MAGN